MLSSIRLVSEPPLQGALDAPPPLFSRAVAAAMSRWQLGLGSLLEVLGHEAQLAAAAAGGPSSSGPDPRVLATPLGARLRVTDKQQQLPAPRGSVGAAPPAALPKVLPKARPILGPPSRVLAAKPKWKAAQPPPLASLRRERQQASGGGTARRRVRRRRRSSSSSSTTSSSQSSRRRRSRHRKKKSHTEMKPKPSRRPSRRRALDETADVHGAPGGSSLRLTAAPPAAPPSDLPEPEPRVRGRRGGKKWVGHNRRQDAALAAREASREVRAISDSPSAPSI